MPGQGSLEEQEGGAAAPGTRWGAGAQSVLPFLTKSLQAKPSALLESREVRADGNPLFADSSPRPGN